MRPEKDAIRIRHMREASEMALRFVAGRHRADIGTDDQLRFALVQAIQVIGEAASKVSPETRSSHAAIPWTEIVFMRNRLVHAYFDIDHEILWQTVTTDIPSLLELLREFPHE